jgi:ribonuclease Z
MQTPSFSLDCLPLSHSVPTVGYRLIEPDGRRMLPEKLASFGVTGSDVGRLQREGYLIVGGQRIAVEQVSEQRRGQRFAFVMDTRLCDAAFALADGADMLVCESTFTEAESPLARDYGHLTAAQAGWIAAESRVRLLVLTHFSQRYGDDEQQRFADEAGAVFNGDIVVAEDLARIPLPHRRPAQRTLPSTAQSID